MCDEHDAKLFCKAGTAAVSVVQRSVLRNRTAWFSPVLLQQIHCAGNIWTSRRSEASPILSRGSSPALLLIPQRSLDDSLLTQHNRETGKTEKTKSASILGRQEMETIGPERRSIQFWEELAFSKCNFFSPSNNDWQSHWSSPYSARQDSSPTTIRCTPLHFLLHCHSFPQIPLSNTQISLSLSLSLSPTHSLCGFFSSCPLYSSIFLGLRFAPRKSRSRHTTASNYTIFFSKHASNSILLKRIENRKAEPLKKKDSQALARRRRRESHEERE
jgi:hypothetical protein